MSDVFNSLVNIVNIFTFLMVINNLIKAAVLGSGFYVVPLHIKGLI